jgi:hypothetical protein
VNRSKDEIITELWKSNLIDDIIKTITSGGGARFVEDLKSELFLILLEKKGDMIINADSGNYLIYLCINILKKQYHSKTSPFHKKFRIGWSSGVEFGELVSEAPDDDDINSKINIIENIKEIVDTRLDFVDRELFKLYYKMGRYDRWTGDLRDESCEKEMSSYRKIERKLSLTPIANEKKIGVSRNTIALSHKRSIEKIKRILGNGDNVDGI